MLKKIVLATAIVTAFATSAFAADQATHNHNKTVVANQKAAWAEMAKSNDTVTPVIQNDKFYRRMGIPRKRHPAGIRPPGRNLQRRAAC